MTNYKFTKTKSGFIMQLFLDKVVIGKFILSKKGNEYSNQAEIYPEFRGQGYGEALLLSAIKTASDLGIDYHEDTQSLSNAMSRIYDDLYDAGYITGAGGWWTLTDDGEDALNENINEDAQPITQRQLDALEVGIDRLFANLGIDIEFTRHFLDRVNDSRNQTQITIRELGVLFVKEYKRWGPRISGMKYDDEAVMTDLSSDINIPVVVNKDGDEKDLVAKTVMRKKKFRTPDPQLTVEDDDPCWDSHKQLGMKKKGGKQVPNCVPKESARHPQTPLTEQQQFMLQRGAWECAQLREAKMDPREAILTQAIQYLDKLAMSKTDKQDISGYAFDIVRSFNIKDIISARELAALYHEWKGTVRHGGVW